MGPLSPAAWPPALPASLNLTVRETAGIARTGEIVRSGVPLPRSLNVLDTNTLTVVNASPLNKLQGEYLSRLPAAVARLTTAGSVPGAEPFYLPMVIK